MNRSDDWNEKRSFDCPKIREAVLDLQQFQIRTPQGVYVPLEQVADFSRGQAPTSISREDGRRKVNVKAELSPGAPSAQKPLLI